MNIIDFVPRELNPAGLSDLHEFAGLVMDQMELRLSARKAIAALSQIVQGAERSSDIEKLVTVCARSKKIKVDGRWLTFEEFLVDNLGVRITHGIDPDAARQLHETRKG